jgi:hypothetical protein
MSAATNQENRRSLLGVKKEKKVVKKGKDGMNQASSAANQGDNVGENNQAASGVFLYFFLDPGKGVGASHYC